MAYVNILTGKWGGNFAYITRKQANVIYSNFKRGNIKMSRQQVKDLYDAVEDTDADVDLYKQVVEFIFKGQFELAQALIDGREVEWEVKYEHVMVATEPWMYDDLLDIVTPEGFEVSFFDMLDEDGNEVEVGTLVEATRKVWEGWVIKD